MDKEPPGSESGNSSYSLQGTGPDFLMEGFSTLPIVLVHYDENMLLQYWDED